MRGARWMVPLRVVTPQKQLLYIIIVYITLVKVQPLIKLKLWLFAMLFSYETLV